MVNSRTLGIFLDTLHSGDEPLRGTRPAAPVARTAPIARVARDASQSEPLVAPPGDRAVASDTGPGDRPVAPDALARRTPDARFDGRADAAPTVRPGTAGAASDAAPGIRSVYSQTPSASLELSATAQWLQRSLLTEPARDTAASIHPSAPLVIAAPGDAQVLAQALRESIAQSGLFYESHLADWAVQRYPESGLRREPQAGWADAATKHDASPMMRDVVTGGALATLSASDERGQVGGHLSVDLMRAQLQTLESRQFSWQGELWPGQTASMTIAEDDTSPRTDLPSTWRTHLTLTLPELGQVDVDLRLDGATLQLALVAAAPHSVELLTAARADLVSALEAHSNTVASIGIRQS